MSLLLGGGGLVTKSCPTLVTPLTVVFQAPLSMGFSSKHTGVGCHFLLQEIFPTQESNPGLLHCRQIPTELQGKPLYGLVSLLFLYKRLHSLKYVSINSYLLIQV